MQAQFDTPCFIFDRDDFEKNIKMFKESLGLFFEKKWIMGYSFKTNYLPYVLSCVKENDVYAEVVSDKEYKLAKEIGFAKDRIIYNGPVKDKQSFGESIMNGCIVNIDAKREIEWLKELDPNKNYKVGIRVNFDLEKELPGHTIMGEEGGRFGFCDDNGELSDAIAKIKKLGNIQINCLHMHVSSKTKVAEIYKKLVFRACAIIERESLDVKFIDVGGSFFGGGDDGSAYINYIRAIKETLVECDKNEIGIIVEPGASVIASCFSYMTEVIDKKRTTQNLYVVTDGSRLHLDPFFARNKYSYQIMSENEQIADEQTIVGFTCMEKDRIMKISGDRRLEKGDRIMFNTVGSYTLCMNSDFIASEPRVYALYKDKKYLVRKEKDVLAYFVNSTLEEV